MRLLSAVVSVAGMLTFNVAFAGPESSVLLPHEAAEPVSAPGVTEIDIDLTGSEAEDLNEKVRPAVVRIRADGSFGTGFIIDDGLIVATAWHVVADASVVEIESITGERRTVRLLAFDRKADAALLLLDQPLPDVIPFELAKEEVHVGYPMYAIGHPYVLEKGPKGRHEGLLRWSFTKGMVSVVGEKQIQTTVEVHPGNSGGPLFDAEGRVVGIVVERQGLFGLVRKIDVVEELLENPRNEPQKRPMQLSAYLSPIGSLRVLPAADREHNFAMGVGAEFGFVPDKRVLAALRGEWTWVISKELRERNLAARHSSLTIVIGPTLTPLRKKAVAVRPWFIPYFRAGIGVDAPGRRSETIELDDPNCDLSIGACEVSYSKETIWDPQNHALLGGGFRVDVVGAFGEFSLMADPKDSRHLVFSYSIGGRMGR